MTVYVDDMRAAATVGRTRGRWSHLFADTSEELHDFARHLGLLRTWVQHPGTHREHYDVTDTMRQKAIQLGAQRLAYPRETGELMARKRAEAGA